MPHQQPQQAGDLACVVQDTITDSDSMCHRALVGAFTTVADPFRSPADGRLWWNLRHPKQCPACQRFIPCLPADDLQRIGPAPSAAVTRQATIDPLNRVLTEVLAPQEQPVL